jgi:hypothetical protein
MDLRTSSWSAKTEQGDWEKCGFAPPADSPGFPEGEARNQQTLARINLIVTLNDTEAGGGFNNGDVVRRQLSFDAFEKTVLKI